ncbi:CLUMA_CG021207, isoform A [Clunio marinus]|uniref:CLUMA_CG021207, isoform A n=1 Tax=Clunio marinus TaxID=568069 RepID=A0A1J1J754_9DIPT|nr:CLUMA_CG021207, isoform A [Clunio marinus]
MERNDFRIIKFDWENLINAMSGTSIDTFGKVQFHSGEISSCQLLETQIFKLVITNGNGYG